MKEIKKLSNWISEKQSEKLDLVVEGRPKKQTPEEVAKEAPKESIVGKDPQHNMSNGTYAIDEPKDESAYEPLDPKTMNYNLKMLRMKLASKKDFFIQGRAGWGKTSIIKKMAGRYRRTVITVYLDKCRAEDLGGIPIPQKDPDGFLYEARAVPGWAAYMLKHKDKEFLLFFDEMNQATPDVMNALMPIVLDHCVCGYKFKNFIVGAAGNLQEENEEGVNELSVPLESRFRPLIKWECDWEDTFNFLHKKWDEKLSKDIVQAVDDSRDLFDNPRDIERAIFEFMYELKQNNDFDWITSTDYLEQLKGLVKTPWKDMVRSKQDEVEKLAEKMYKFMNSAGEKAQESTKRGRKGREMLEPNLMKIIEQAMVKGYFHNPEDRKKYGFSRENIWLIVDIWNSSTDGETGKPNEPINRSMLERYISVLESEKKKFMYEKDDQWRKDGLIDPMAD